MSDRSVESVIDKSIEGGGSAAGGGHAGYRSVSFWKVLVVTASVVGLDQVTKAWAVRNLKDASCSVDGACIDLFGSLRLHLVFNPGAAFSSFTSAGPVLGVVAILMSAYLLTLAYRAADRILSVLFAVVAGGAIGNLTDRIFRAERGLLSGEVVDFVDLQFWPIFNVSDVAVVGGVIALASRLWWVDRRERSNASPSS